MLLPQITNDPTRPRDSKSNESALLYQTASLRINHRWCFMTTKACCIWHYFCCHVMHMLLSFQCWKYLILMLKMFDFNIKSVISILLIKKKNNHSLNQWSLFNNLSVIQELAELALPDGTSWLPGLPYAVQYCYHKVNNTWHENLLEVTHCYLDFNLLLVLC